MLTRSTLEAPASNLSPRGSGCYCLLGRFAFSISLRARPIAVITTRCGVFIALLRLNVTYRECFLQSALGETTDAIVEMQDKLITASHTSAQPLPFQRNHCGLRAREQPLRSQRIATS